MKPEQRVILYRNGLRKKTAAEYHNEYRLAKPDYFECPKCGRAVKKGESGNLKKHYSDFPNRIHCPAGIDKQCKNTNKIGVKRGPYRKRSSPNTFDKDKRPVESLYE